ncbi:MAG: PQQ-dependent sugar dehydrogenase [Bacteroidota bacterium]
MAYDLRGNTNDDRGKILRIHPEPDGTYTIPEGNLFPKGIAKTKPEIYIMGVRNPYRITIDKKSNYLFWGEVGPDAAKDSSSGPRGYDEFNMAKQAGNFGWPLVIGNNKPYPRVYYNENNRIGEKADTLHPINHSVNNTGLTDLPAAHPAIIWYPYDSSNIFTSFGAGGRTAIGGPFYQYDASLDSKVKFPAYFDHCWFIADWMRNWIKLVHFTTGNGIERIDNFLPDTIFKKPICMKFGPDGALYVLEFGSTWGENPDGRLVKIEYEPGNCTPIARLALDKAFGKTPLTVNLSADNSIDFDNDPLQYEWKDDKGKIIANGVHAKLVFDKPGRYTIRLTVKDNHGAESNMDTVISAGNAMPGIQVSMDNHTFYWDTLRYSVEVKDEEDGIIGNSIHPADVKVSLQYFASPYGFNAAKGLKHSRGEVLLNESDCNSCHQLNHKSAGPSFTDIAQRYNDNKKDIPRLAEKILKGGSGVWGNINMSAHPQLDIDQATQIVEYIYSLVQKDYPVKSLPVQGTLALHEIAKTSMPGNGYYVLQAAYTDKGGVSATPLSTHTNISLRNATVRSSDFEELYEGIGTDDKFSGRHGSGAAIKNIDLTGIRQLQILASGNGSIDIHLDSVNGPLISKALFTTKHTEETMTASLKPLTGVHSIYFVFTSEDERFSEIYLEWIRFNK